MGSIRCIKGDDEKILVEEPKIRERCEVTFLSFLMVRETFIPRVQGEGARRVITIGYVVVLVKRRLVTL